MKYVIKEFEEVFAPNFIEFISQTDFGKHHLKLIMEKVEAFEKKYDLEFVAFYGAEFIVFKKNEN